MNEVDKLVAATQKLSEHLGQFALPIVLHHKGRRPLVVGTGFFVAVAGETFLISAAHVFDYIEAGHRLYIYTDRGTQRILDGYRYMSQLLPSGNRDDDPIDIGVMLLRGVALPPYPDVKKLAVPWESLAPRDVDREGKQYVFVGFPSSQSKANSTTRMLTSTGHGYMTTSIPKDDYPKVRIAPKTVQRISMDTHIAMPLDTKRTATVRGELRAFPKPHGMSGAPLWRLGTEDEGGPRIVGVLTRLDDRRHVVIASDITPALEMISLLLEQVGGRPQGGIQL